MASVPRHGVAFDPLVNIDAISPRKLAEKLKEDAVVFYSLHGHSDSLHQGVAGLRIIGGRKVMQFAVEPYIAPIVKKHTPNARVAAEAFGTVPR